MNPMYGTLSKVTIRKVTYARNATRSAFKKTVRNYELCCLAKYGQEV